MLMLSVKSRHNIGSQLAFFPNYMTSSTFYLANLKIVEILVTA